jgi:hypothetical protein
MFVAVVAAACGVLMRSFAPLRFVVPPAAVSPVGSGRNHERIPFFLLTGDTLGVRIKKGSEQ